MPALGSWPLQQGNNMRLLGGKQNERVLYPFLLLPLGRGGSEPVTELGTLSFNCFNSGKHGKGLNQTSGLWLLYAFFMRYLVK